MPLRVQEICLEMCGICQGESASWLTKVQRIVGFLLIMGGWFSFLLNALIATWAIVAPARIWSANTVTQALCLTPYASINLRAVMVVTVFFFKQKQWRRLTHSAKELIAANLHQGYRLTVRRLRVLGLLWTFGSLILLVTWEVLDGMSYIELNNQTAFDINVQSDD